MNDDTGAGANSAPLEKNISWQKVCTCNSTASTGQIRFSRAYLPNCIRDKATFYQQPSCDKCGKPWVQLTDGLESENKT